MTGILLGKQMCSHYTCCSMMLRMKMIMMMMMIFTVITALKGELLDFLQSTHHSKNCLHQGSSHGNFAMCRSCTVLFRHVVQRLHNYEFWQRWNHVYFGVLLFGLVWLFISFFVSLVCFFLLKLFTDVGWEAARVSREHTVNLLKKKGHVLRPKSLSPERDWNWHSSTSDRLGQRTC